MVNTLFLWFMVVVPLGITMAIQDPTGWMPV